MASIIPPIAPGQFDDAEENVLREGNAYVDTYEPPNDEVGLDWLESEGEDEDDIDEEYEDSRVEDEDWENAERGMSLSVCSKCFPPNVHRQISQNSTTACVNMSLCALEMPKGYFQLMAIRPLHLFPLLITLRAPQILQILFLTLFHR
jgi:hypothetical protein